MLPSLMLLLSLISTTGTPSAQLTDWTAHPLIAHALGGIDGKDLTNSREAFELNYARGFRVFETDLMLTRERDELVARHDWENDQFVKFAQDQYVPNLAKWNPLSLQEFIRLPINNRYNALTWPDILQLMEEHPDAYFVLDTKFIDEPTILQQYRMLTKEAKDVDPSLLDRIVPQLYNQKMLATIESVHVFKSYIYTLYLSKDTDKQVADFVRSHKRIQAVAMAPSRAKASFVKSLKQAGAKVYVHTINDMKTFDKLTQAGVYGIYTDFIGYPEAASSKGIKMALTSQAPLPAQEEEAVS